MTGAARFSIRVDGEAIEARAGDTVASALLRAGRPLPMFCGIGLCQLCLVEQEGHLREACRIEAAPGLELRSPS